MSGADTDDPAIAVEPPARPPGSTARHALGGMIWSGLGFGAQGIGQFLVVIVFARYLTKTDNGVVAARGTHDELIATYPPYRSAWAAERSEQMA